MHGNGLLGGQESYHMRGQYVRKLVANSRAIVRTVLEWILISREYQHTTQPSLIAIGSRNGIERAFSPSVQGIG